jgi:enamine deaminase RidA (YjgF/YER057c/UK114 family)
MEYLSIDSPGVPVSIRISRFAAAGGMAEYHLVLHPTGAANFKMQMKWLREAYQHALKAMGLNGRACILRRFFCSDIVNQAAALAESPLSNPRQPDDACSIAWVGQPPSGEAKIALWAWLVDDPRGPLDKEIRDQSLVLRRGELSHWWTSGFMSRAGESPQEQTRDILGNYEAFLKRQDMTLADEVVRTWIVVQDIDVNYAGMVAARKEFFAQRGLTPQTHFIASTGIGGIHADPRVKVGFDAYAIQGVKPAQIEFLAALDHLSPTHVYGVTFERGVAIAYRDRRHVILSGTASIDSKGQIMHPGNVSRQLDRTLENMGALLKQAGASLEDMGVFIAYLRDAGDQAMVWPQLRERLGDAPVQLVNAPVCRPGWLIELEGMATIPAANPALPAF